MFANFYLKSEFDIIISLHFPSKVMIFTNFTLKVNLK